MVELGSCWTAVEQLLGLWRFMLDISMANLWLKQVKKTRCARQVSGKIPEKSPILSSAIFNPWLSLACLSHWHIRCTMKYHWWVYWTDQIVTIHIGTPDAFWSHQWLQRDIDLMVIWQIACLGNSSINEWAMFCSYLTFTWGVYTKLLNHDPPYIGFWVMPCQSLQGHKTFQSRKARNKPFEHKFLHRHLYYLNILEQPPQR